MEWFDLDLYLNFLILKKQVKTSPLSFLVQSQGLVSSGYLPE